MTMIPEWLSVHARAVIGGLHTLDPVERFVHDHEPQPYSDNWRADLDRALHHVAAQGIPQLPPRRMQTGYVVACLVGVAMGGASLGHALTTGNWLAAVAMTGLIGVGVALCVVYKMAVER